MSEYNDRLDEVPTQRDGLDVIGHTTFNGDPVEMRKFNVLLATPETEADWEEMPWLMGQGVGLVEDISPAAVVVERMMAEARERLAMLAGGRRP